MDGAGMKNYPWLIVSIHAVSILVFSVPVQARTFSMVCKNAHREYAVRFDKTANTFFVEDTAYRILAIESTQARLAVVGLTINDGPTFRAYFRPQMKIEYFENDELFQTDGCR
jgi:hypothetical protein